MRRLTVLGSVGVIALLTPTCAAAATPVFTARGNEPFWAVEITETGIAFRTMEGETITLSPRPEPSDGTVTYLGEADGQSFSLSIADELCIDSMSGMNFPKTVTVSYGQRTFSGCGGEPASLLHGEWGIEQIDGKPIVAGSQPTPNFGPEGRISGNASCNRYFGGYELTGEGLAFSQLGSTKMACEQALMDQEHIFLQVLGSVSRFDIDGEGKLVLHGNDGRTLTGHRK